MNKRSAVGVMANNTLHLHHNARKLVFGEKTNGSGSLTSLIFPQRDLQWCGVISAMVEKVLGERNFGFDSLKSRLNHNNEEKGIVARDCLPLPVAEVPPP